MTYPFAPLPVVIEFWNGTTWVDITAYVYSRDGKGIDIRRGFPDEGSTPEPGECSFELNNRDGRFSPRNPSGPYYGLIGRNTLVRVTVTGYGVRFVGEISEWPSRWDKSGRDVWVPVTAQGILRRLGQGSRPLRSPIHSGTLAQAEVLPELVAYWPMEDAAGATSFGSALAGGTPMTWSGTRPDSGENGIGPLLGSNRIPVLASNTTLRGRVGPHTSTGAIVVRAILDVPTTPGWADNTPIYWIRQDQAGSTVATWEVRYKTSFDGSVEVRALDADGTQLAGGTTSGLFLHGFSKYVVIVIEQDGSDVDWTAAALYVDDDGNLVIPSTFETTFTSLTVTRATEVVVAPTGGLAELAIGHLAVITDTSALNVYGGYSSGTGEGLLSYRGETAADRADRLATEIGVAFDLVGAAADTERMGAQGIPSSFAEVYNETWAADLALAFETRDSLGLSWRARADLYNQTVALTLDYTAAGEVAPDLEPTDDDQHVRNDVTVKRTNGSSARAVKDTGPLSVADPPDGVGRYDDERELNLYDDAVLVDFANWLLHVGTTDEARYPRVHINMAALAAKGKTALMEAAAALDVGDRIQITNPPSWLPPDTIDLMVVGFAETSRHPIDWDITLVCVPYGPWLVGEYAANDADAGDEPVSRYDTAGCQTAPGLWVPATTGAFASTPDAAALDVTGDLDLRADITPASWLPSATQTIIAKGTTTGDQRSYWLELLTTGQLRLNWSTDGTSAGSLTATSTASVPLDLDRRAVRVTIDVNDGGGNRVINFYTASPTGGLNTSDVTFVQLGSTVTTAGTTSIFASTGPLQVGERASGVGAFEGIIHAAQVRNGINSTIVAYPRFDQEATGTTSFADSVGLTWTVNGTAGIYHDFISGTNTSLLVYTTLGPPWTTDSDDLPMDLKVTGAVLQVTAVTGTGKTQLLTVTQTPVNGVAKTIEPNESVSLARPAYYAL